MKETEKCVVCGKPFGVIDYLTGKSIRMLSRNGKHICTACYGKYLSEITMRGEKEEKK